MIMKYASLHILLPTLLFVACAGDVEEPVVEASEPVVLSIPISVYDVASPLTADSRTTGDPGVMEDLPAPTQLYIWVDLVNEAGEKCLYYVAPPSDPANWTREGTGTDRRWVRQITAPIPEGLKLKNASTLQFYIIATHGNELPESLITGVNGHFGSWGTNGVTTYTGDLSALQNAVVNLNGWENSNALQHSTALGNLYSTPLALMGNGNDDATAAGISAPNALLNNGTYTVIRDGENTSLVEVHPTRLYHCAAKADFKWEVATALQPDVSVESITVTDLPTQLRVFQPTHNPAPTADASTYYSCRLLGTGDVVNTVNDGNRWIGRRYAYVLQPPTTTSGDDGRLTYDVTFTGGRTAVTDRSSSPATNPVFTTWYRINANIRP